MTEPTRALATSLDGEWAAAREGRRLVVFAHGAGQPVVTYELAGDDADLAFVGPPTALAVITRDGGGRITLYQPPSEEVGAHLDLDIPATLATTTGPRFVLLSPDSQHALVVRSAGRALGTHNLDLTGPIEFVVGLERNQLLLSLPKKLEVWDAVSGRPLLRAQFQLPPPPRVVGAALGHLWAMRPGGSDIYVYRLSDGRAFPHHAHDSIVRVICHPLSPTLVLVTARGLMRLHCYSHTMTSIQGVPDHADGALGLLVQGEDERLLGWTGGDAELWHVQLSRERTTATVTATATTATIEKPVARGTAPERAAARTPAAALRATAAASAATDARATAATAAAIDSQMPSVATTAAIDSHPPSAAVDSQLPTAVPESRSMSLAGPDGRRTSLGGPESPITPAGGAESRSMPLGGPESRLALGATEARAPSASPQPASIGAWARAAVEPEPPAAESHDVAVWRTTTGKPAPKLWREVLVDVGDSLVRGEDVRLPNIVAGTELDILVNRVGVGASARRAITALYAAYLVGERALPIATLARAAGVWSDALGQGELAGLAMLRRRHGRVALRTAVTDMLDGAPPRSIQLVGSPATTPHAGAYRVSREGRSDAEIQAELLARLKRIAIVVGSPRAALLESRLHGATAVMFTVPDEPPRPWPSGAGIVFVLYSAASSWLAGLPAFATTA